MQYEGEEGESARLGHAARAESGGGQAICRSTSVNLSLIVSVSLLTKNLRYRESTCLYFAGYIFFINKTNSCCSKSSLLHNQRYKVNAELGYLSLSNRSNLSIRDMLLLRNEQKNNKIRSTEQFQPYKN